MSFIRYNPLDASSPSSKKKQITLDDIKSVLHLNQPQAAKVLNISSSILRSHFKKYREELSLCRWPTQKARQSIQTDQNIIVKTEEEEFPTDENGFPLFNKSLNYKKQIKHNNNPFTSREHSILYLPSPLENNQLNVVHESIYSGHTDDDKMFSFNKYELQDFLHFLEMKKLEKDICDRMIGRVANGFKKVVFCMPVSKCIRTVFTSYFDMYGQYCSIRNRKIRGYDSLGYFTNGDAMRYVFEFPYLPTFRNGRWTLNQYSIDNNNNEEEGVTVFSDTESVASSYSSSSSSSSGSIFRFPTTFDDDFSFLGEELKEFREHCNRQIEFNEGWDHLRNMVYRLSITHNSITDMVTVSFSMISLKLWYDGTYKETL